MHNFLPFLKPALLVKNFVYQTIRVIAQIASNTRQYKAKNISLLLQVHIFQHSNGAC